ncbi:MAG: DNA translocase FtsK 4TM domain-containing protein [Candidatus Omnitrophota bacterium]|nr:MAG: DNA translocase FtsK 4TM domain-containing protein [Candidatus Omnitrophota bacterium]
MKIGQSLVDKIKALCLIAFAIFILLSLISYHPQDTSFRTSHPNIPVKNLIGVVGAYMAEGLFMFLGAAAYILCSLSLAWAWVRFLQRPPLKLYIRLSGAAILLVSSTVLLSLFGAQDEVLKFQRAGLLGTAAGGFVIKYFGRAGTLIISLGLTILSSFVSTEFLILPFFKWLGNRLFNLFLFLKKRVFKEKIVSSVKKIKIDKPVLKIDKPKIPKPKIVKPPVVKKPLERRVPVERVSADYKFPGLDLLDSPPPLEERQIKDDLQASSHILEATLRDFNVETRVTQVSPGPVITRYELEPAPGVKIHRIVELSDDIALAMKASSVRIVAPIPGKSRVGVEVPNSKSAIVYLREILESAEFQQASSKLTLCLGKDISGQPLVADLADMPHLLIAGTTGSGKTVCMNSIITSLIFNASPDEIKFLMVDPKMVELAMFNGLPHLLCPVLTNPKKVSSALAWVVSEMEERYKLLAKIGARNIDLYNEKIANAKSTEKGKERKEEVSADFADDFADSAVTRMPYIVVIIDELADLMVVAQQQVEGAITRLAQLSRAVGIHLILATQRPSVDVVTGVIKANFPARISFRVASRVDSRTVLDMNGADKLLGKGDLLFLKPGQHKPVRAQGSLIFDSELERIVNFIKAQKPPLYNQELMDAQEKKSSFSRKMEKDDLFDEAVKVILQTKQASVSMLQRRLGLGYTRAARLIDMMEEEGVVGPYRGSKPREILIDDKTNLNQEIGAEEEVESRE